MATTGQCLAARFDADQAGPQLSPTKPSKIPRALLPPADARHDDVREGRRGRRDTGCRASLPMTDWNSRTINGYGMRAQHGPEQVVGAVDVGHPVAHRFVDGILQRSASAVDAR